MPPGAVAVILLLNGLQIAMPQPAFVLEGRAWIPARAVLAAAGWQVGYDPDRGMMLLTDGPGPSAQIHPDRPEVIIDGDSHTLSAPPRRLGDTLLLPADAFSLLGMEPQWYPDTRAVHLQTPQPTVPTISIHQMKADPFAYLQRRVSVSGEYLRPLTDPPGAWLLRDRQGHVITCREAVRPSAPGLARERTPLQPGARLQLLGRVYMSRDASLWLDIYELMPNSGPAALTCIITTDRHSYQPGRTVLIELELANLTPHALSLSSLPTPLLIITDPDGEQLWSRQVDLPTAVEPGHSETLPFFFSLPEDLPAGQYTVDLHSDGSEPWAASWCFTVVDQ